MTTRRAVFLDRDGVIIENQDDYVRSWEQVCFLPQAFETLRCLARTSFIVVLVTNQSAIGRGLITLDQGLTINRRVVAEIERNGGRVEASYLCPHRPEDRCTCRKPAPGMLLQAAGELDLDLSQSYLIGDALSDVEAARSAGVTPILVLTGRGVGQSALLATQDLCACTVLPNLREAFEYIMDGEREPL